MNITNKNSCSDMQCYIGELEIEPILYKFVSLIHAKKELKVACNQNRLVTWLNNEMNRVNDIYPALGISESSDTHVIKERINIAKQYATILEQYVPDEKGDVKQKFNYFQLIAVIKKVFKNHIEKNNGICSIGFEISVENQKFYAKVEAEQIFILFANPKIIGEGNFGYVAQIYEIGSQQLLAVKFAKENPSAIEHTYREISVLKNLHALANSNDLNLEGVQAAPLATFDLPGFHGYLGPKYGIDLIDWSMEDHSNEERIAMCRSIMRAFINMHKSGFWHGDIKPENILMGEDGVVIIDWDGSIPFHKAVEDFVYPKALTAKYINSSDLISLDSIIDECDDCGASEALRLKFLEMGNAMELFSLAMVFFVTLVPIHPFDMEWIKDYKAEFPLTRHGIPHDRMEFLLNKNYSDTIVQTIVKMLSHDPHERYLTQEAIAIWETIK